MQYVREISGLDTTALCAYLQTSAQPFEFSQLFDASTGKKVVDDTERSSHFRAIKDPKLFEIAERLVEQVSASDESRHLSLVRNDVTQIVYQEGDFFKKHQDYLAVTSNVRATSNAAPRLPLLISRIDSCARLSKSTHSSSASPLRISSTQDTPRADAREAPAARP